MNKRLHKRSQVLTKKWLGVLILSLFGLGAGFKMVIHFLIFPNFNMIDGIILSMLSYYVLDKKITSFCKENKTPKILWMLSFIIISIIFGFITFRIQTGL